ncbi:UNKNOWN [Stylonychia lemnae]|uniref:Uncharacterized protein n=1 Tax=Stylonychia lemnae TaxID=5949 RepID=A0A078B476_STYLE|nr:UNKNOWN [Stylonychia lemnae]|eukprot:CDW88308.1 UNKNOWN [Stylonychia lemnae]
MKPFGEIAQGRQQSFLQKNIENYTNQSSNNQSVTNHKTNNSINTQIRRILKISLPKIDQIKHNSNSHQNTIHQRNHSLHCELDISQKSNLLMQNQQMNHSRTLSQNLISNISNEKLQKHQTSIVCKPPKYKHIEKGEKIFPLNQKLNQPSRIDNNSEKQRLRNSALKQQYTTKPLNQSIFQILNGSNNSK